MNELTESKHAVGFITEHLQKALEKASILESIVLIPLIEDAVTLERKIGELEYACGEIK